MRDLAKKRSALTATSQVIKVVCCSIARTNIGFGLAHVVEFCMNELTCVFFVSLHINVRRPSVLIQSSNRTSSHVRANMRVLSALTLAFVALHVCEGTYRKPYRSGSSHKKPKTLYQQIWNYRKYGIFTKMVKIFSDFQRAAHYREIRISNSRFLQHRKLTAILIFRVQKPFLIGPLKENKCSCQ